MGLRTLGRGLVLLVFLVGRAPGQERELYSDEAREFLDAYLDDWNAYVGFHAKPGSPEAGDREDGQRKDFERSAWAALRSLHAEDFPDLGGRYKVTDAQVAFFRTYGFLHLPQVFTEEEIDAYRGAFHLGMHTDVHPLTRRPGFIRVYNLWDRHEVLAKFVLSERLGQLVSRLLACDTVRLYQDQTFFKGHFDGMSPPHQDMMAAPFDWAYDASDALKTLGAWIPFRESNASRGSLGYVPGSHKAGKLGGGFRFRDGMLRDFAAHMEDPKKRSVMAAMATAAGMPHPDSWPILDGVSEYEEGIYVIPEADIEAGDVLLHDGWTVHAAGPQQIPGEVREAIAIQYLAEGLRRGPNPTPHGLYNKDSNSVKRWGDDVKHGDVVRSEWLPVVFSKAPSSGNDEL